MSIREAAGRVADVRSALNEAWENSQPRQYIPPQQQPVGGLSMLHFNHIDIKISLLDAKLDLILAKLEENS